VSRIAQCFAALRGRDEAALVAFFTCGDPDLATTRELVRGAVAEGADLIELGVPFSDPMADGPTLQRAAGRALAAGTSPATVTRRWRATPRRPAPTDSCASTCHQKRAATSGPPCVRRAWT
jgi:tryptophan synthase alpha subunit